MRRFRLWLGLVAVVVVAGALLWAWWAIDLRWRPKTISHDQAEIAAILDHAGWVSARSGGRKLYLIAYRDCADCRAFERATFPRLQAAGVDARVIVIARADTNGLAQSTPSERATVAELWLNRDWGLLQRWLAADPSGAWSAAGLPSADGDMARTAVIVAGRTAVDELAALLKDNGLSFGYPTAIWWSKSGVMRACVCRAAPSYGPVEHDLGA
jgi:hypothetical protein